ncbi:MAG: ComEC/Rec2 family competence protein, partial [Elusimicrobiota bacterium]
LIKFSLRLKQRLLLGIRKTMPYPQSGFLGGVCLGLRSGVHPQVRYEFQATGVAHVLAVSGLHVGFVAFLLVMGTSVLKVPARRATILIVFGLIVFTIITGASPATRRAALMFSMYFIFREFGLGAMRSSRLTIPVSAFILMTYDPLKIFDASFVMSYIAVWSLAYVSWPVGTRIFSKYMTGIPFILNVFWIAFATFTVSQHPSLYRLPGFLYPFLISFFVSNVIVYYWQKKAKWVGASYNDFPRYIVRFTWAQLGIQIGMMYPLSALYFNRFPVSGVFANFIAIPLIGVVVQLGLVASSIYVFFDYLGLTQLGLSIGFLINAGNYIAAKFFMDMSHFFSVNFPYPYMEMPTSAEFIIYYIIVSIFVWWDNIRIKAKEIYWQFRYLWKN